MIIGLFLVTLVGFLAGTVFTNLRWHKLNNEVVELRRANVILRERLLMEIMLSPGDPEENARRARIVLDLGWDEHEHPNCRSILLPTVSVAGKDIPIPGEPLRPPPSRSEAVLEHGEQSGYGL